jgi:hypothetical protein
MHASPIAQSQWRWHTGIIQSSASVQALSSLFMPPGSHSLLATAEIILRHNSISTIFAGFFSDLKRETFNTDSSL